MATINGSVSKNSNYYTYYLEVTESNVSIANNTSVVTATLKIYTNYSGALASRSASATHTITIDGTNYSITTGAYTLGKYNTVTLGSASKTVTHNSDGSKTVSVSASSPDLAQGNGWGPYSGSASGTMTLTTIPRASSFSASGNTIGSAINVNITRASSSFTHTVKLTFGSASETKTNVGESTSFTPSLSTYGAQIPNATSGTGTITVDTYNGSTKIGSSSQNITLNMPSSAVPTISSVTLAEAVSGLASKFGAYIQQKSKISYTVSASGIYGSTIKSYKVEINGSTYNSSTGTTGVLTQSGSNTCKVTVTDSRGRTATSSKTFTVLAYQAPQITVCTAQRNSTTQSQIDCVFSASITSLNNKNNKAFTITSTVSSGNHYSKTDAYSISNATCAIANATTTSSYVVTFKAQDYFTTVTKTINIGTAFALMNFATDGKHMSIGKIYDTNEGGMLQVGGDTFVDGSLRAGSASGARVGVGNGSIEIYNTTPYIDFHFGNSTADYTSRIIETASGTLSINGKVLKDSGTRGIFNLTSKSHTNYNTNQDYVPTVRTLSYWNGAHNSNNTSNLTYAHQGVIQCKPISLYDNSSGAKGTVTLSQTAANFNYLEIFYGKGGERTSVKVSSPNGKAVRLVCGEYVSSASVIQMVYAVATISGTSITKSLTYYANFKNDGSNTIGTENEISIYKVIGYK